MQASASPGVVSLVIQWLPHRLLGALDAWSHRVARRRHQERMRKWQERQLAAAARQPQVPPPQAS